MSVEYHDNFKKGETWTLVVTLLDSSGAPLVPTVLTARLWDWAGNEVTKTLSDGIVLSGAGGNEAEITFPTTDTDGLAERLHRIEIMATKDGALSRQITGTIGVVSA
jgi:hypothetical protein